MKLIQILPSFLNRSINIIMDNYYLGKANKILYFHLRRNIDIIMIAVKTETIVFLYFLFKCSFPLFLFILFFSCFFTIKLRHCAGSVYFIIKTLIKVIKQIYHINL